MKKLILISAFIFSITSCNQISPGNITPLGDTLSESRVGSGSAKYVYLDVYDNDPDKKYKDVDSSNYAEVLQDAFNYCVDLSLAPPTYCRSGNFKGRGNYVYISTVCDGNMSKTDFFDNANIVAEAHGYNVGNFKTKDSIGSQQTYKLIQ